MRERLYTIFRESAEVKLAFLESYSETILKLVKEIAERLKKGRKILIFGNGGSACDSQHFATELVGRFKTERNPLPAIALTSDTCLLTALGNDYGFKEIFARQIKALAQKDDIVIGISTSGKSPNVIEALKVAKELGCLTVAFTGKDGGIVKEIAEYVFIVPSYETPRIQECHITLAHALCELLEIEIFK
jgi:D-sedoheptulose 7-phosphate isomerase